MRRLLFSMAMLGLTSALAIGATTAYFSDTEVSSANTFVAGTLDLTVDGENDSERIKSFTVENMKPGDTFGRSVFKLKNVGTLAGIPEICITNVHNIESTGSTEYEGDGTPGELGDNIELIVDTNGHELMTAGQKFNKAYRCWSPTNPADAEFKASGADILDAGEEMTFGIRMDLPTSVDNNIQGDSLTFDIEFNLTQAN